MDNRKNEKEKDIKPKPDPETLHTTDPQENMKGPFSSTMHKTGHGFETNESKEEAERKRDERL